MKAFKTLADAADRARWDYATDIDWSVQVGCSAQAFDDALFGDGFTEVLANADAHALRHAFSEGILQDVFWGELHSAMTAHKAASEARDRDVRRLLLLQRAEEANHAKAFSRYIQNQSCDMKEKIEPCRLVQDFMTEVIACAAFNDLMFGLSLIEDLGKTVLRKLDQHARCPAMKQILRRALGDESRHVEIGRLVAAKPSWEARKRLTLAYTLAQDRAERAEQLMALAESFSGIPACQPNA